MDKEQSAQEIWDQELASKDDQPAASQPIESKVTEPAATEQVKQEPAKPTTEELLTQALARVEKLEGRTRNVEGHIGGLTSQQRALHETLTAARTAAVEVKDAPTQAQVKEAISNPEQWERLKGEFPDWSEATEKFLDSRLAGIKTGADVETVNQLVAKAVQQATVTITQDVEKKIADKSLSAVFPGWKQDINSDAFSQWVQAQPEDVKSLAASDDVGDAARMLSLFKDAQKANPAQQILDTRKQKLNQAVAAPRGVRPAPTKTPDQMSPTELWDYEAKQRERAKLAA